MPGVPRKTGHAPDRPQGLRIWAGLIVIGVVARFLVSAVSLGTNDAAAWLRFGDEINHKGLLATYQSDPEFNHPPIPGLWAAAVASLAGPENAALHDSLFTNIFKIPVILADCVGIYLLVRIWRRRIGIAAAMVIAALFACSLDAILVSGFHCNTDPIYVMLCLLAIYLLEDRGRSFWGGFALGAAINVKLIPVLLIPGVLLNCRKRREALQVLLGLGIWVLPFVPILIRIPRQFLTNVLTYNSVLDRWGVDFFLLLGKSGYTGSTPAEHLASWYYFHARYFIWGLVVIWAVLARLRRRWSLYEVAAVSYSIFLVLAPGFGVQYTVLVGLPLFAIRPAWGTVYGWLAGLFVAAAYFVYWTGTWPAYAHWRTLFPMPAAVLGLMNWFLLLAYIVVAMVTPARPNTISAEAVGLLRGT